MVPDPANLRVDPLLKKVLADWIVPVPYKMMDDPSLEILLVELTNPDA